MKKEDCNIPAFSTDPNNCGHWGMDISGKCQSCGSYGGLKKEIITGGQDVSVSDDS